MLYISPDNDTYAIFKEGYLPFEVLLQQGSTETGLEVVDK